MTQPWPTEEEFSNELLLATRHEKSGDPSKMTALTSRMEALESAGKEFYPGSPGAVSLGYYTTSENLSDWAQREKQARTAVRVESRPCGCRVHYNNIDEAILVDPECPRMARCRDLDQKRRHMVDGVQLDC